MHTNHTSSMRPNHLAAHKSGSKLLEQRVTQQTAYTLVGVFRHIAGAYLQVTLLTRSPLTCSVYELGLE
jgi:hypothetical protein